MDTNLWKIQTKINEQNSDSIKNVWGMMGKILNILQDNESDKVKMCNKINELERELNKLKEGK